MNHRLLTCVIAAVVGTTVALASPALARGGHGGHGGHGGMHGGMRAMGGGAMHFRGMGGAPRAAFAPRASFAPRFARASFHRGFHHRFHHRRFAFIGAPYLYAGYDSCWRRLWTSYGPRWVNVCASYGYYGYY